MSFAEFAEDERGWEDDGAWEDDPWDYGPIHLPDGALDERPWGLSSDEWEPL